MDGRGFEDNVSVKDLMNMPQKELMANIYLQTLKTNGTVNRHEEDITCLQKELKEKIDWHLLKRLSVILGLIISSLTVPSLILNILRYVQFGNM